MTGMRQQAPTTLDEILGGCTGHSQAKLALISDRLACQLLRTGVWCLGFLSIMVSDVLNPNAFIQKLIINPSK